MPIIVMMYPADSTPKSVVLHESALHLNRGRVVMPAINTSLLHIESALRPRLSPPAGRLVAIASEAVAFLRPARNRLGPEKWRTEVHHPRQLWVERQRVPKLRTTWGIQVCGHPTRLAPTPGVSLGKSVDTSSGARPALWKRHGKSSLRISLCGRRIGSRMTGAIEKAYRRQDDGSSLFLPYTPARLRAARPQIPAVPIVEAGVDPRHFLRISPTGPHLPV